MIIPTDKQLRKRDDNDYYPTPIELCVSALGLLPDDFKPFSILDPGAGDGVWGSRAGKVAPDRRSPPECFLEPHPLAGGQLACLWPEPQLLAIPGNPQDVCRDYRRG